MMKNIKTIAYFGWIFGWILFFTILLLRGCNPSIQLDKVKTPEIKSILKTETKIKHDTIFAYKEIIKNLTSNDKSEIDYLNKRIQEYQDENNEILDNYQEETDSLKKLLLFKKAIELRHFSHNFEDSNIKLSINGIVDGEVKEITPNYTIKSFEIPQPKNKIAFLYGGGISATKTIENFNVNAGIGIQNKKGNILFMNYNSRNEIGISFYKKIRD